MKFLEKFFFVYFALFLTGTVFAATISETTFAGLGHQGFVLEAPKDTGCFDVPFAENIDSNYEVYGVISIHADFSPIASKKSVVDVFLNNEKIGSVKSIDFANGFARYNTPQGKILEENDLRICAASSFETTKIEILSDSKIGYYLKPDFEKPEAFELHVNEPSPRVLEEFTVTATLRNFGSEPANVLLKYRKDSLEKETPETELLKGQTQVTGVIPACKIRAADASCTQPGEVEFNYQLRPKLVGPISLLPSTVEFENPFGEIVLVESDRPTIWIVEPEIKIKPFISVEKEQFISGEKANARLLITNEGHNPLYNLYVRLDSGSLAMLKGTPAETIEIILPNETISREFMLSTVDRGTFGLGCSIDYLDYNVMQSRCENVALEFKNPSIDITIAAAFVLVLISVGIYAYLHFKK